MLRKHLSLFLTLAILDESANFTNFETMFEFVRQLSKKFKSYILDIFMYMC